MNVIIWIIWTISVLMMVGAVWLMRKRKETLATVATVAAALSIVFAFLVAINDAYVIAAAFTMFTVIAAIIAIIADAVARREKKDILLSRRYLRHLNDR